MKKTTIGHLIHGKGHVMTTLYVAIEKALAVVSQSNKGWKVELQLIGSQPQCLAVDLLHQEQVYCGTFDKGLWQSADAGASWKHVGEGISHEKVMSVAVSATEREGGYGVVYAGTEPSAIFRSEDQGNSWQELATLQALPSASTWSFPPRPWTSHIRWITPDPLMPGPCLRSGRGRRTSSEPGWGPNVGGSQTWWSIRYPYTGHAPARAPPVVLGGRGWFYASGEWLCSER